MYTPWTRIDGSAGDIAGTLGLLICFRFFSFLAFFVLSVSALRICSNKVKLNFSTVKQRDKEKEGVFITIVLKMGCCCLFYFEEWYADLRKEKVARTCDEMRKQGKVASKM